jgi:Fur family transcriptional regulator, ferric uptake regulator
VTKAGICECFANNRFVMGSRADYVTRPREWISAILQREPRFLSAAEIHRRLKSTGARVSLSTVYRTLEHLRNRGDVSARADAEGEATYLRCEPAHHHHHAICRSCGRVEDVDCEAMDQFAESLRSLHGFTLDEHAMEFFGRCSACQ